ncbi:MAG: type I restriction endonuclease subunit R [Caldisericum sp.]|uniref:type I restriction endonuclease subunit R n=1 Tax=Caldisericum sp. TaxID=2499687 RepID=UPI003D0F03DC
MTSVLDEEHFVENDFLKKLKGLGWRVYRQDAYNPEVAYEFIGFDEESEPIAGTAETFRENFSDIILEGELRNSLKRINPFLDDSQVSEVVRRLTVPSSNSFIEINREIHELLTYNTSVSENPITKEKSPSVKYIDLKNTENNSFIAISQFKVSIQGTENHIIPDIVLFVNGIPLVVVECKSPAITDPIYEAITQLMRYSERRDVKEGNKKLFYYNLLQIATARYMAKVGTITSEYEHFVEWKDPYPYTLQDLETGHSMQDIVIQGVLSRENLLDLMHTYTIFRDTEKGTAKIVARYHQFRAVKKIIEQIKFGKTPLEKGGIIWHTQGSGKSLTMMFTVRDLYHHQEEFGDYKIVFITDRIDLERQLNDTSKSVGFTVKVARSIKHLQELLKTNTPELVMCMISKFQETELQEKFPLLNTSPKILIMIDEAHRSEYKELGANLQYSLPNAVRIAFTGTPIDKTETTFGEYIDRYTIKQSIEDGVTVPILYEGRAHIAEVKDREAMNRKFEDVFRFVGADEKKMIMGKYTWLAYLEDRNVIKDKAKDMVDHYVENIFVNGFKAQVVTASRLAAARYRDALTEALKEKIDELMKHNPLNIDIEKLRNVKITAIISGTLNDEEELRKYTNPDKQEMEIKSFKLPFGYNEKGISGDMGIIVVQSMLITGFDAPIEQVIYLDNVIQEHNLLQAIARVNRVYKNKSAGFVIDYVGVFNHLKEALANYYEKDINEIWGVVSNKEEAKDKLTKAYNDLVSFFLNIGIKDFLKETNVCIDLLLSDEERRNEFYNLTNNFNRYMDIVLPDPYALRFKEALKTAGFIKETLRNALRQGPSVREASEKVKNIVEEYLVSKGIEPKIPETNLLDNEFLNKIKAFSTAKQRATALETATRKYIIDHLAEDPELYERFAEKLEEILKKYKENWDEIDRNLKALREEIKEGRSKERDLGLDKNKEMPFFGILLKEIYGKKKYEELSEEEANFLVRLTKEILSEVKKDIKVVDFWDSAGKQKALRAKINYKLLLLNKSDFQGIKEANEDYLKKTLQDKRAFIAQHILETAYYIFGASHERN